MFWRVSGQLYWRAAGVGTEGLLSLRHSSSREEESQLVNLHNGAETLGAGHFLASSLLPQTHRIPLATQGWTNGPVLMKCALSTAEERLSVPLGLVRKVRLESSHEVQVQVLVEDREMLAQA